MPRFLPVAVRASRGPVISRAVLEDAAGVARIHVDAWQAAYAGILSNEYLAAQSLARREAYWQKAIALAECELLLARIHRKIVGWVAFGRCRDAGAPPGRAEIWALYVAPSSWSQGVGRALCREARSSLAGQGYRSLSLWVLADNARAIRFYVAAGFLPDPSGIKQISMGGKSLKELRYVAAVEG
ncbi:GNAT family N-acetyltransferase [Hydrocarboniphaga sp.]|uniref:GNAT family N-acetyltransferase n=1 Tax=Hydrocarboniphaga sp. TaxID=2033016 RepID=UPI003452A3C8